MSTRDRIRAQIKALIDNVVDLTDDIDVVPDLQTRAARMYRKLDEARTIWLEESCDGQVTANYNDAGPTPEDLKGEVTHGG